MKTFKKETAFQFITALKESNMNVKMYPLYSQNYKLFGLSGRVTKNTQKYLAEMVGSDEDYALIFRLRIFGFV